MGKTKIKKVILYISFIPYIYLLFSSLYYSIFGYKYIYINETVYGIEAFLQNIGDFWFDNFTTFNFISLILTCFIIYQIWYFITSKRKSNVTNNDTFEAKANNNIMKKIDIRKAFFIISCTAWILYFLYGIYVYIFGYPYGGGLFSRKTIYGIQAFKEAMFWNLLVFSFIPILPISLIYIVVYSLSNRKRKDR